MNFWLVAAAAGARYLAKYWQNIARDRETDGLSSLQLSSGDSNFKKPESPSCGDLSPNQAAEEMDSCSYSKWKRSHLRTKLSRTRFIKPMSSLESCLLAHMYKEHAELEEYVLTSLPSRATPTMRSLFVTDGSRVISSAYNDTSSARIGSGESKLTKEAYLEKKEKLYGVPSLPEMGYLNSTKKMKAKTGNGQSGKLSSSSEMTNGKDFHSQGSRDETVLFCIGISIGMISSFITNKSEVDKLRELLKQSENLVQDLQEELEMKDSLRVKELANENNESRDAHDNFISRRAVNEFLTEQCDGSTRDDGEDSHFQKAGENSECISKIEAELEVELEAELEKLGLNMNASTLERRLSEVVELDLDFEAAFAQGELRVDTLGVEAVARSIFVCACMRSFNLGLKNV